MRMMDAHVELNKVRRDRIAFGGLVFLSLVGIALSLYLLIIHYLPASRDSVLFQLCSVGAFNCDRVNSGQYSVFLGLPIAAYGLVFYFFVLFILILRKAHLESKLLDAFVIISSAAAAIAVFPLFALSTFVIKAFCLYCVIAWLCNFAIFGLSLALVRGEDNFFAIFRGAWKELRENPGALHCIAVIVLFLVVTYSGTSFLTAMLGSNRQYANLQQNMRMEEQAFDEYVRRRPVPMDIAGLPVYYGDPSAKVTIVEYFNFDCHVCRSAAPIIKSIIDKYPGKVRLFLKHYPLDGTCNKYIAGRGDGLSCRAALVAIALQKSPKHREYIEYIMTKKGHLKRETVLEALEKIDMNADKLRALLDEKIAIKILESQIDSGEKFKIQGTPSFIINGKIIPTGLPPARFLERIIKLEIDLAYGEQQ